MPLSILFGAAFTIAVMWALGRLLFRSLAIELYAGEQDLLAAATGGALLSFTVFLLCAAHVARTAVFVAVGVAALALAWRATQGKARKARDPLPPLPRSWQFLFAGLMTVYAVVYLSNSFAPEISPDGQTYHLGLVYRFFREHGFHRLTTNSFGNLALGVEMLFLFAFSLGRNSAAATVHCCCLLALPLLIVSYARRIGRPRAGVCAAMIVFLSPVVGIDGISAYNDVALATTAFALFYLLEIWRDRPAGNRLLIPIGLLAGFCFAIKLTGFVAFLYAALVILMQKRPRALLPLAAAAAPIAFPWLVKDWLWVGNPVSPFLNRVFPNPYVHVLYEDAIREYFRHYDITSFSQWVSAIVMGGQPGGAIGPVFYIAPLALLALRSPLGRRCLLAALFFLITYPQNISPRFLIPAVPFIALGIAYALEFSKIALALATCAAAVAAWPGVMPANTWRIADIPWRAALRIEPQDAFLGAHSVPWVEAKMLDYFVPRGKLVWSTTPVGEAWGSTDVMVSYQSAEGDLIEDTITTATRDDYTPTWNWRFRFPKMRIERLRLEQGAKSTELENLWSIGEIHIFDGDRRVARDAGWRLDASPFPWDIGLAFDDNPVTRWRSWEKIYPGMRIDINFGKPIEIDRVEMLCSHDEPNIDVRIEVCDSGCKPIEAMLEKSDTAPSGDLRRLAAQIVKAHGIDYILVDDANWTAADMSKDPARWGMEFIANRAGNRLYRLQ